MHLKGVQLEQQQPPPPPPLWPALQPPVGSRSLPLPPTCLPLFAAATFIAAPAKLSKVVCLLSCVVAMIRTERGMHCKLTSKCGRTEVSVATSCVVATIVGSRAVVELIEGKTPS